MTFYTSGHLSVILLSGQEEVDRGGIGISCMWKVFGGDHLRAMFYCNPKLKWGIDLY